MHQDLPFERLVQELNPERRTGAAPVFQVVFNFAESPVEPLGFSGLTLTPLRPESVFDAKYDLILAMSDAPDGLQSFLIYSLDLFDRPSMERLSEQLCGLAARVVEKPTARSPNSPQPFPTRSAGCEPRVPPGCARNGEKNWPVPAAGPPYGKPHRGASIMKTRRSMTKKGPGAARRRSVSVSSEQMIRRSYLAPEQTLPLVLEAAAETLDPVAWAAANAGFVERELVAHGAILFRNFGLGSSDDFERFSRTVLPERVNYVEGSSPRISTGEKVYTSTEYPAGEFVSLHNELSYAHKWPSKLMFFCDVEPGEGGETPIADSRKVLQRLRPELVERFRDRGVRYVRNLHGGRGAGLSWQTVFETEDKDFVESYCQEGEIRYRWTEGGGLWTEQYRPAVRRHPQTGDEVWFNQVDQWHPSNLKDEAAQVLLSSHDPEALPIWSTYGDQSHFEEDDLEEIRRAFDEVMVRFPWRRGDALLVDNMLAAHGRMPFSGPRRVLVAMGDSAVNHRGSAL